jgi:hypothetical protein
MKQAEKFRSDFHSCLPQFEIQFLGNEDMDDIENDLKVDPFKGDVSCIGIDYVSNRSKNL